MQMQLGCDIKTTLVQRWNPHPCIPAKAIAHSVLKLASRPIVCSPLIAKKWSMGSHRSLRVPAPRERQSIVPAHPHSLPFQTVLASFPARCGTAASRALFLASQPLRPCARGLFCLRSMHQRHTHTSAACAVLPDFWQKCDAIERFVCFCVCRKNPLALRAKMLPRAQFCYLRRSRFSTCCRQIFDTLFNNILYISALQTTMSCGIVHHAAQEAVVATADMHQRRRLSHCTQKTATRKAGGQGAGDNHQGERK